MDENKKKALAQSWFSHLQSGLPNTTGGPDVTVRLERGSPGVTARGAGPNDGACTEHFR